MNYLLITILLLTSVVVWNAKRQTEFYYLFAIIFSLVFANRDFNTADTLNYVELFQSASIEDGWFAMIDRYEFGYCFVNRFLKVFTNDYRCLFFVISFSNYVTIYYIVKWFVENLPHEELIKSRDGAFMMTFTLYSSYYGLLYNSIVMRGCVAMSFFFLACISLYNHKIIKGVILYLLSVSFHQTALLTIPLLFLFYYHFSIQKKTGLICLFLSFLIYIINLRAVLANGIGGIFQILYVKFPDIPLFWWAYHYVDNGDLNSFVSLYMLFSYLLVFVLISTSSDKGKLNIILCLPIIGLAFNAILGSMSIFTRASDYMLIFICFAYAYNTSYYRFIKIGKKVTIPKYPFIFMTVLLYYYVYLHNVGMQGTI